MQKFENYISKDNIIRCLCQIRAKQAEQLGKMHLVHVLTLNDNYNYHLYKNSSHSYREKDQKLLERMLPRRRKWKKLPKEQRYDNNKQRISTYDQNFLSLLITVKYYLKKKPNEDFIVELNKFVRDVQESINNPNYAIKKPVIFPKFKKKNSDGKDEYRPIAIFNLKDRLIIKFTNKYFTDLFDSYFYNRSYAFRSSKRKNVDGVTISHHDAIQDILIYKKNYYGKRLWVAECDICKFYDSVNHSIVMKCFNKLFHRANSNYPDLADERAKMIFISYLQSYTFTRNVLPFNCDDKYWNEYKISPNGAFGWIEEESLKYNFCKDIQRAKIGVAQGGALSGLIANIVLDYADQKIEKLNDPQLRYVRFCDDMVLIHPSKIKCEKAASCYFDSLKSLHLIPHEPKSNLENTPRSFWSKKIKSKNPYKWSSNYKDSFHWFGFVGYEIHFSGNLRVRKKSILKEKKKQKQIVTNIIAAIKKGRRKTDNYIFHSAANRLIGMSVGRINITNYNDVKNEMCWVNGFKLLNDNKHIRAQLKDLDRYRVMQLSILLKSLKEIEMDNTVSKKRRIRRLGFLPIVDFTEKDSEIIRDQLVINGILSTKFQLVDGIDLDHVDLGLDKKYEIYKEYIIEKLKHPYENKKPIYYGKPFSYYYQTIERKK